MTDMTDMESSITNPQQFGSFEGVRGVHGAFGDGAAYSQADIHLHTNYSDGKASVEEVLDYIEQQTDLDVIAVTDHDTIDGALHARDLAAAGDYRFEVIVGEEISTREGHMLALFLETPVQPGLSIERSIELVHAQGGLAIVAHPFNRAFRFSVQREVMNRLLRQPELHPDGIETLNGSFAGIGSTQRARLLAREVYHWPETGGSDGHTLTALGCARTLFPGSGADGLREALRCNQTVAAGTFWHPREYLVFVPHLFAYLAGSVQPLAPALELAAPRPTLGKAVRGSFGKEARGRNRAHRAHRLPVPAAR